jgi:hypothetical protein
MQTGPQNEMAIEKGAGFSKKSEQVFAHQFAGRFRETPL